MLSFKSSRKFTFAHFKVFRFLFSKRKGFFAYFFLEKSRELLFFVFAGDDSVDESREDAACERSDDEYPDVGEGVAADEERRSEGAGGVDGGTGEGDSEDVDKGKGEADNETRYVAVLSFGGNAEDGENENAGEDDFDDKGFYDVAVVETVLTELGEVAENSAESGSARDSAGELSDDINDKVDEAHFTAYEHGDRNGRVDVAAGNVAYGISHGNDNEAEGKRRKKIADGVVRDVAVGNDGSAAGEEDENESADEFGKELFEISHCKSS